MKKYYKFAGIETEVSIPDQWCYEDEHMLEAFKVVELKNPERFSMEVVEELTSPDGTLEVDLVNLKIYSHENKQIRYIGSVENGWSNAYIRVVHDDNDHYVQVKAEACKNRIGVKIFLKSLAIEHLVLLHEGVVLHASYIVVEGKAILFTAPSGSGKSTQAELWKQYKEAEIINGDRAVLRMIDGKPYACGIPFAGSSSYCKNGTFPLKAIVYLEQGPITTISRMNNKGGFKRVWEGCTVNIWNKEDLNKAIDLVSEIVGKVPVYHLQCTPDESAVTALEKELE